MGGPAAGCPRGCGSPACRSRKEKIGRAGARGPGRAAPRALGSRGALGA